MKIELAGWESEGFRCPNVKVDLISNGVPASIALIQMPNGTGKTSTLNLIKATLGYTARTWTSKEVLAYRRIDSEDLTGRFTVHLYFDDKPLTFELTLDYTAGTAKYRTSTPGDGGMRDGWVPPHEVRRFFHKSFLDLFIFDGELANNLLNEKETSAAHAIDALFQIYLFEEIESTSDSEWNRIKRGGGATTSNHLTKCRSAEENLIKKLEIIKKKHNAAKSELAEKQKRLEELTRKIDQHIEGIDDKRTAYEDARLEFERAKGNVEKSATNLMGSIAMPHRLYAGFSTALTDLRVHLDRLKLPENTSAQFFKELSEDELCVCGRPIDESAKNEIINRSKLYLGEEQAGILNAIKSDVSDLVETVPDELNDPLDIAIKDLTKALRARKIAQTSEESLKKELIDGGDTELGEWEQQKNEYEERIKVIEFALEEFGRPYRSGDDQSSNSIASLERQIKDLGDKIAGITDTVEFREQTKILAKILKETKNEARQLIRNSLLSQVNTRLKSVLGHDPLQLQSIGKYLVLERQSGASVGQTLGIGYTFLTTLLGRGKHKIPLVVDSPAGSLDDSVRTEVGNLIPDLTHQFVSFVIPPERAYFVDSLKRSGRSLKYITIFRKTPGTEYLMPDLPKQHATLTNDGVVVVDDSYFMNFKLEKEESGV